MSTLSVLTDPEELPVRVLPRTVAGGLSVIRSSDAAVFFFLLPKKAPVATRMLTVVEPDADALWTKDEQEHALREAEASCFLLRPSPRRFVLFPIQHRQARAHARRAFWK